MDDMLGDTENNGYDNFARRVDIELLVGPSLFAKTEHAQKYPDSTVRFVEFLCESQEKNFEERVQQAIKVSGANTDVLDQKPTRDLIHYYLSYFKYNNKHQLLLGKQIQLWNLQRLVIEPFDEADLKEEVSVHEKMNTLCDTLCQQIEQLYSEIYGAPEIQAIAQDAVKQTMSPEERLKRKKKV